MAQIVNWSSLVDGATYPDVELYDADGNPGGVILHFDTPSYIDPYDIELLSNDDLSIITVVDLISGKTVTFELDGLTVTRHNVTFEGGGLLLVGDDDYGTANDNAGNHLIAGDDWDQLVGLLGDDTLDGGLGNDVFIDRSGANTLFGGGGLDFFYVYQDVDSSSTVTGGDGQDFYYLDYESPSLLAPPGGLGNNYVVTDFEVGPGGDIIYTSDLVYLAIGYEDEDPFAAGFLRFREQGGTLYYEGDRDGAAGIDHGWITLIALQGVTEAEIDFAANFPDLLIGTAGSESLLGTARADLMASLDGDDVLDGLAGKDYLAGGTGSDVLDGGTGADTMLGGAGDDLYRVDHADDEVVESDEPASLALAISASGLAEAIGDTVEAAIDYALDNANLVENLVLVGSAARGTGNDLANYLEGNAGKDTLEGGAGKDTLDGAAGNDRLFGDGGADRLIWDGNVQDRFDGGGGTDRVVATTGINLTQVSNSYLVSVEQIDLTEAGKQKLTLNGSDVLDLSDTTNPIKVLGTSVDVVNIVGAFTRGSVSGGYRTYTVGSGTLLVDDDIVVT